jgi:hypothetical protein
MDGSRKDDDGIRGQTVRQIDEVHVFFDHGDEEVVLQERGNGGIPETVSLATNSINRRGAYLDETSTLTGLDKLARCNFATFVVMVAENK